MLNVAGIQIFGVPTNGEFIDEDHTKESVAILGCKSKKKYFAKPAFLIYL